MAGLISFPILTRIFSVSDYGLLSLVTTTVLVMIAVAKMGFPNAIVRFYAEFKTEESRLTKFYSTMFQSSVIIATIVTILFVIVLQLLPENFLNSRYNLLFSLAAILILTRSVYSILISFLRAEQKTKLYNLFAIFNKYGSLACSLFFVFFFFGGLYGFFIGQVIASAFMLLLLLVFYRGRIKIGLDFFCLDQLKKVLSFGLPLFLVELGHLIFSYVDRYMIQYYLGPEALGLYSAGYNLSNYVVEAIIYPINYAMMPIYMNIFVNQGELQTKKFLTKLFSYFLLVVLPAIFGFVGVGRNLISLLATSKYVEVSQVLPYIVFGRAIYACAIIISAGLYINKKTKMVSYVMSGTCVINIILNVIFIPRLGILGAALATLISFFLYTVILTYFSMREFSFSIEYKRVISFVFASASMWLIIRNIDFSGELMTLLVKVVVGVLTYTFFVVVIDREIRCKLLMLWKKPKYT